MKPSTTVLFIYPICENKCPKECNSTQFKIKLGKLEDNYYSDGIFIHSSFFDLSSLEIIQIPKMNSFDFVSNVGGLLGLFIGVCFLSLVEVIELFIDIFFVLF